MRTRSALSMTASRCMSKEGGEEEDVHAVQGCGCSHPPVVPVIEQAGLQASPGCQLPLAGRHCADRLRPDSGQLEHRLLGCSP